MKAEVISKILTYLQNELASLSTAAKNAHLAAIDDQSVAETQYDTLAIEASYLAEGQSRRVEALKKSIIELKALPLEQSLQVSLGSLVQLSQDTRAKHWFFIAAAAAGFRCKINDQQITVITPQSPMGQVMMEKYVDDEIQLLIGNNQLDDDIAVIK